MSGNGRGAPGRGVIGDNRGRGNGASPESLAAARGPPAGAWGRGAPPIAVAANPWAGRGRGIAGGGAGPGGGTGAGAGAVGEVARPVAAVAARGGGGGDVIAARGRARGRGVGVEGAGPSNGGGGGRGGGRGGGGGRGNEGREGRMARRKQEREDAFDCVKSRPREGVGFKKKQAGPGKPPSAPVTLLANYFKVEAKTDWALYHYRVDFLPDETDTRLKKGMLRIHQSSFGGNYVFDGSSLFMANRLNPDPLHLCSENGGIKFELVVRMVAQLSPTDPQYLQIFNIIVRKCLEALDLEEMGRHFYDRHQAIKMEAQRLELWPGFKTSMRNHEQDILLGVEITHKVLRLDNCLMVIKDIMRQKGQQRVAADIVGVIVMTSYNRKTYKVDDIDWGKSPMSTFEMLGKDVTFVDYFKQKYNLHIRDVKQPLLISRPKKKDFHRGMTGPILLIPELCQMTGLTDEMRSNNQLMKALSTHLHIDAERRVGRLKDFMKRMINHKDIKKELESWGLRFQDRLTEFGGHVIPREKILFANGQAEDPDDRYDWSRAFRSKAMLFAVELRCWVVLFPSRDDSMVDRLVSTMQRVAQQMKFRIDKPLYKDKMSDTHPGTYTSKVKDAVQKFGNRLQMVFAILPRQATDTYSAIKRSTCADYGILSQCFVAKNAQNEKNLMSICTKLVVQMNAKLGGEPWTVSIPLTKLMIVGFDVYHCGKRRGASVGALVVSMTPTFGRYYSTVAFHSSKEELSSKIANDFAQGLHEYKAKNNFLPDRIMFFRDGVGDGQLRYVYETELEGIKARIKEVYSSAGSPPPKLSFIVVTKRINTRIFTMNGARPSNPPPGCVADDVITLPERYDFYLVSQFTRQGTVAPVSYNVLYDESGIDCDKIQRLTFKLCHMYYNWSGTVTVPAVCQYAHKLAYLTGLSLNGQAGNEQLSNKLYYL